MNIDPAQVSGRFLQAAREPDDATKNMRCFHRNLVRLEARVLATDAKARRIGGRQKLDPFDDEAEAFVDASGHSRRCPTERGLRLVSTKLLVDTWSGSFDMRR